MLGRRFFACERCETVYAAPGPPPYCDDCNGTTFRELTHSLQDDAYFEPR